MLIAWMIRTIGVFFIDYACIVVFTALISRCTFVCAVLYASVLPVLCLFLHPGITACIESMFKLIMLSAAMSGIPNNVCPFPGTTKNTHLIVTIYKKCTGIYVTHMKIQDFQVNTGEMWCFIRIRSI